MLGSDVHLKLLVGVFAGGELEFDGWEDFVVLVGLGLFRTFLHLELEGELGALLAEGLELGLCLVLLFEEGSLEGLELLAHLLLHLPDLLFAHLLAHLPIRPLQLCNSSLVKLYIVGMRLFQFLQLHLQKGYLLLVHCFLFIDLRWLLG